MIAAPFLLSFVVVASPRIGEATVAAFERGERVRAVVVFDDRVSGSRVSAAGRESIATIGASITARCPECVVERTFTSVPALVVDIGAREAARLLADPRVLRIDADIGGHAGLQEMLPVAHFPGVHAAGFTGAGTRVAVIDSGIDHDHPDFAQLEIYDEACFCGDNCCPDGAPTQFGLGSAEDAGGHGTFVTSVLASAGVVSSIGGAPGIELFPIRVLDENDAFCCTSDITAALDTVANSGFAPDVVNMSLLTDDEFTGICDGVDSYSMAMAIAVQNLVDTGTFVVACSGNSGSDTQLAVPACLSNVVAVGAVYDDNTPLYDFTDYDGNVMCTEAGTPNEVACFSSNTADVEILAPGVMTEASWIGGGTDFGWGTSFASPMVAACVALLREGAPDVTVPEILAALAESPTTAVDPSNGLTFPTLDCVALVDRFVDLDDDGVPGSVDNCPEAANPDQNDADGDERGDACDVCPGDAEDDADGDGRCADEDNCPDVANAGQADDDEDGLGNACDDVNDASTGGASDSDGDEGFTSVDTSGGGSFTSSGPPLVPRGGDDDGCGCRSAPGSASWWLLPIVVLARRRRRLKRRKHLKVLGRIRCSSSP